jgi:O-antigen/teichoic acid export membrane protein
MAYNIANVPVASLAGVVGKISFPAYSILQNEPERLKEAFKKVFEAVMIILLPLIGLIFLLAQDFTAVCLGEKWLPMVPALKILCLFGLFRGLNNVFAAFHLAVNRPNIQSRNKTIELVAFLILVYPLTLKWGLVGVSWGVTIVYGISALINTFDTSRLLRPLWTIMANAFVFPLGILAILLVIFLAVRSFIPLEMDLWRFLSSVFLCLIAYGGTLVLFKKQLLKDILSAL